MIYQVGKKQCSISGRKQNDIAPLESDFMVQPPSLLEFPGPLTPPPPWNFQFPPWWGSGYFLELHIMERALLLVIANIRVLNSPSSLNFFRFFSKPLRLFIQLRGSCISTFITLSTVQNTSHFIYFHSYTRILHPKEVLKLYQASLYTD